MHFNAVKVPLMTFAILSKILSAHCGLAKLNTMVDFSGNLLINFVNALLKNQIRSF